MSVVSLDSARRRRPRPPLPAPPVAEVGDWLVRKKRVASRGQMMAMLGDASSHGQAPTIKLADPRGKGGRLNSTCYLVLGVLRSGRAGTRGRTHVDFTVADVAELAGGVHEDTARRALHRLVHQGLAVRIPRTRTLTRPETLGGVRYPAGARVTAACLYGLGPRAYEVGLEATRRGRGPRRTTRANPAGELAGQTLSGLPSLRELEAPTPAQPEVDAELAADVAELERHLPPEAAAPRCSSSQGGIAGAIAAAGGLGTPAAIAAASCDPKDLRFPFRESTGREPSGGLSVPSGWPEVGGVPVPPRDAAAPADAGACSRAPRPDGRDTRGSAAPAALAPLRPLGAGAPPRAPRAQPPDGPARPVGPLPEALEWRAPGRPGESTAAGACDAPGRPSPALPAPPPGPPSRAQSPPACAAYPPTGSTPPLAGGPSLGSGGRGAPPDLDSSGPVDRAAFRRAVLGLGGGAAELLDVGTRYRWAREAAGPPAAAAVDTRGTRGQAPAGDRATSAKVPRDDAGDDEGGAA